MKVLVFSIFIFLCFVLCSCDEDALNKCYHVEYVSEYCPEKGASLLKITNNPPDSKALLDDDGNAVTQVALLELPEEYKVRGKSFYVKFSKDESRSATNGEICPSIFGPVEVFVCDYVSESECQ